MKGRAGRLVGWFDDRLNPIVVKELRQAVQGRFVSSVLNLLLLIQLSVLTVYLLTSGVRTVDVVGSGGQGRQVFGIIFAFLLFMTMLVLPFYAAVRLYLERAGEGLSLLFITTLPPRRIISGKLLANQLLAVLLFVACLPFVSFTYFLRGVDLPSILVVFALGFVAVSVCLQAMILLACLPGRRFFKVLLALGSLVVLLGVFGTVLRICGELLLSGVGSQLGTRDFWLPAATFLGVSGFVLGLTFLLSVALVSPPAANRAPPVRLFLSGAWLLSGAVTGVRTLELRDPDLPVFWVVAWVLIAAAALIVAVSTRDRMSARAARDVPRSAPRRALAFLFWSGSAPGTAWAAAVTVSTLALGLLCNRLIPGLGLALELEEATGFAAYCFAYPMTALLVQRRFLAHRVSVGKTWVVALVLLTLGVVLPLVTGFLVSPEDFSRSSEEWRWSFLNPTSAFEGRLREPALRFGLLWSFCAAAMGLPWFSRQLREFGRAGRTAGTPASSQG